MSSDDFRKELDQRAISRGCTRLMGTSFGQEIGTYQGYSFTNGRALDFIANDKSQLGKERPAWCSGILVTSPIILPTSSYV